MPKKLTEESKRYITRQCRNDAMWFQIIRDLSITARHVWGLDMVPKGRDHARKDIQAAPPCGYDSDTACNQGAQKAFRGSDVYEMHDFKFSRSK